jgi:hypothetical protein
MQRDEDENITPDDPDYGGIPDTPAAAPDLLTLYRALAALAATGDHAASTVCSKARVFIDRCQASATESAAAVAGFGTDGVAHNWRDDLVRVLLARYNANGSWGSAQDDANLATAHAVRTLNRIVHSLR